MGTDLELLERAAKAAGLVIEWRQGWDGTDVPRPHVECRPWNPLTDDGDALRLAVRLGIHLGFYGDHVAADRTGGKLVTEQRRDADVQAATRRAIVRAAAAIGDSNA